MADSPYPEVSKEILFHPTHRFLKLCLGWSLASSQPRVTPLTIPIHPCPYSASSNTVTLYQYGLLTYREEISSTRVKFLMILIPRVIPCSKSTYTVMTETPLLCDRHLLSSQDLSSFLCGMPSLDDGSLWILWIWKWWQRQIAGPRKFSSRKQNTEVNKEQRTGKKHSQGSQLPMAQWS